MPRNAYKKYILYGALVFALSALPPFIVEGMRGRTIALFSPFWRTADKTRRVLTTKKTKEQEKIFQLEGENHLLKLSLKQSQIHGMSSAEGRRESISTRVIYRNPSSWGSSVWVNVGKKTNTLLKKEIVAKNSPVLLGRSLVGLVDYVGQHQSRVRLITSREVKPAVRVVRGGPQKQLLGGHIDALLRSEFAPETLKKELLKTKEKISGDEKTLYLAKGFIQGSSSPLWRSQTSLLTGMGFNYDFPDEKGAARDLRGGKPKDLKTANPTSLIQVGDLLVTTGMDSLFPPDLLVAEVTKVHRLREGAVTYEIEATAAQHDLNNLETLFIIPPLNKDYPEILEDL